MQISTDSQNDSEIWASQGNQVKWTNFNLSYFQEIPIQMLLTCVD